MGRVENAPGTQRSQSESTAGVTRTRRDGEEFIDANFPMNIIKICPTSFLQIKYGCFTSINKVTNHSEMFVHHSLYGSKGMIFHKSVTKLLDFVLCRENPYEIARIPLYNFITKQVVDENVSERLVNAIANGQMHYKEFHDARIISRGKN